MAYLLSRKRSFMKLLINNNITNKISDMVRAYHSLITLERINRKLYLTIFSDQKKISLSIFW